MITALKRGRPQKAVPAGTTWTITESGQWEVPATGQYQVELHGGGGGAAIDFSGGQMPNYGASGGGSGEVYTLSLVKGQKIQVVIGSGGAGNRDWTGYAGGESSFGSVSIAGGGGGTCLSGTLVAGGAVGTLATSGTTVHASLGAGGLGNKNKPNQTYGNGGNVFGGNYANSGQPGAAIITFLGA